MAGRSENTMTCISAQSVQTHPFRLPKVASKRPNRWVLKVRSYHFYRAAVLAGRNKFLSVMGISFFLLATLRFK